MPRTFSLRARRTFLERLILSATIKRVQVIQIYHQEVRHNNTAFDTLMCTVRKNCLKTIVNADFVSYH